ncbi:hypothetical protein Ahy_B03g065855 [Arachis hypogaea]|uniref:F-box domain-containing protein n=1 Tax=Arachis hypogaea TaxID=3818 RepID=A0A445A2M6_ARAHY|nr:hypothetical protein Ahy_B03g065855 [Arachis hypogaea]
MAAQHPTPPQAPQPLLFGELEMEILSWIPAKPLTRLKLVCKSWNSIISNPHFVKLHLQRSPKNANLLVTLGEISPEGEVSVVLSSVESFIRNPSSTLTAQDGCHSLGVRGWVLGSCNGLVCIWDGNEDYPHDFQFRLWNPLTGFSSVKSPPLHVKSDASFGFGYDESSDGYKVAAVYINYTDNSWETTVEVYRFGSSSWRNIDSFPAFPIAIEEDGMYVGGTLNWLALQNTKGGVYDWGAVTLDMLVIVSLELKSETYKQIQLPNGIDELPSHMPSLNVWGYCLYLSHDYKKTHFIVWQMKEFGDEISWTQMLKISFQHINVELPLPLFICGNGDIFVLTASNGDISKIVLYDPRVNSVEHINILDKNHFAITNDYVESLGLENVTPMITKIDRKSAKELDCLNPMAWLQEW